MPTTGVDRPLVLVAAGALIRPDSRILVTRRPAGKPMAGLWELPGGKVEAGETPEAALVRELGEELGLVAREDDLAPLTFASHAYAALHLLMPVFVVRRWTGEPLGREQQAVAWVSVPELRALEMPAADRPLIPSLETLLAP